jgi:hypothetical protein
MRPSNTEGKGSMDNQTRETIVALARALMETFATFRIVVARQHPDEHGYVLEQSARIQQQIERVLDILENGLRTA